MTMAGSAQTSRASPSCWAWGGDRTWWAADDGVDAVGEVVDPAVGADRCDRGSRVVGGGVASGDGDAVEDRAGEDVAFLGDHGDEAAALSRVDGGEVGAADVDGTGPGAAETGDEAG